VALVTSSMTPQSLMWLAIAAYVAYVINAAQFLLKFSIGRADSGSALAIPEMSMGASR